MDGSVDRTVSTGPPRGWMSGVGLVHGLWVGEFVCIIPAPLAYQSVDWRCKLTASITKSARQCPRCRAVKLSSKQARLSLSTGAASLPLVILKRAGNAHDAEL